MRQQALARASCIMFGNRPALHAESSMPQVWHSVTSQETPLFVCMHYLLLKIITPPCNSQPRHPTGTAATPHPSMHPNTREEQDLWCQMRCPWRNNVSHNFPCRSVQQCRHATCLRSRTPCTVYFAKIFRLRMRPKSSHTPVTIIYRLCSILDSRKHKTLIMSLVSGHRKLCSQASKD